MVQPGDLELRPSAAVVGRWLMMAVFMAAVTLFWAVVWTIQRGWSGLAVLVPVAVVCAAAIMVVARYRDRARITLDQAGIHARGFLDRTVLRAEIAAVLHVARWAESEKSALVVMDYAGRARLRLHGWLWPGVDDLATALGYSVERIDALTPAELRRRFPKAVTPVEAHPMWAAAAFAAVAVVVVVVIPAILAAV